VTTEKLSDYGKTNLSGAKIHILVPFEVDVKRLHYLSQTVLSKNWPNNSTLFIQYTDGWHP